ncbi:MAG TPA: SDR family oxidoreductase [Flavipsychrobacter sp.]|nr:SDR family oxidoreductase [Flavipsychrobacter sp.]
MNLKNSIAIVTGASKGLGEALSKALINKGTIVYGIGRNENKLIKLQTSLGERFHPVSLDLTDEMAVTKWVASLRERHLPNILINNAGVGSFGKIDEMPSSTWQQMIHSNLIGLYNITAPVVALMKQNITVSHIINIGSVLGWVGREESTAYCTAKFGVRGFSEALYLELRKYNIKVTCVSPGSIETDFFKSSGIEAHGNMLQPDEVANTIIHLLESPDNMLINEITIRPLHPQKPSVVSNPSA